MLMACFAFVSSGCAKCTSCGQLRPSTDVTSMFNSVTISPEYDYYTYNETSTRAPLAILGIDKKYTVKTSLWKKSDFTEKQLAKWVRDYRIDRGQYDDFYNVPIHYKGWRVEDPTGETVGVYYSTLEWTIFKFLEDNVIELGAPQPSIMQQSYQRGRF